MIESLAEVNGVVEKSFQEYIQLWGIPNYKTRNQHRVCLCGRVTQLPSLCILSSPHNHDEAKFFFQLKAHQQPFSALEKKMRRNQNIVKILVNNLNMIIQTHRLLLTHIIIQLKDLVRITVLYKMQITIIHVPDLTSFLLSFFISYTQSLF